MTLSLPNFLTFNFDALFDRLDNARPVEISDEERRRIREMVVTHDPAACGSEYGAFALMALFPGEM